ncbi:DUF2637 domain-containing protein [Actinomadura rugatobispora]|uniref:DUF2637 domain-containing protein n=1 Tax=Actinomadura rugatobispora TaxID=1994 RepID=A0ABW0ZUW0_9ACTN|nr:hypothetical protein GCM10010200_027670 [Actinomadura rugatobispora]
MSPASTPVNDIRRGYPALWMLGLIVMAASVTAFAESYNGLRKWAEQHRVTGVWADIWPLQVDAFIAAGELTLLLSALYLWPIRVRVLAWTVSLTGLSVSVLCNAGHVGERASVADHLTAALPPVAAIAGLVISLSVIKQVTLMNPNSTRGRERAAQGRRGKRGRDEAGAAEPAGAGSVTVEQVAAEPSAVEAPAEPPAVERAAEERPVEALPAGWWSRRGAQRGARQGAEQGAEQGGEQSAEPVAAAGGAGAPLEPALPNGAAVDPSPQPDALRNRYDRLFGGS